MASVVSSHRWPLLVAIGSLALSAVVARAQATAAARARAALLVDSAAPPRLVARQFKFTEGPAVDRAGNVFFTDQPNNRIWQYDTAGKLSLYMEPAGRANGMYFDHQGNLIACADEQNELWRIGPDKRVTVLAASPPGRRFNGPNDVWVDAQGGMFFTDPYYPRDYWTHTRPERPGQYVYYLAPGQAEPVLVETTLKKPNGLIGTPDGKYLYIADIDGDKTYRYRLAPGGQLTDRHLFVPQGSDGMTLDERGNVYLTGKGVTIYSPAGERLAHLAVPEAWTGNICFSGADRRTLFITASEGVYVVPMRVRGAQ